jgi:uncharacterized membrane protein YccC
LSGANREKGFQMKFTAALPAAALLVLAACGGGSQSDQTADRLEEAAEQSDPAAASALENSAESIREGETGANAQEALQQAGNAQAATVQPQQAPPSMQAQPNRTGQQIPPPKIPTGGQ